MKKRAVTAILISAVVLSLAACSPAGSSYAGDGPHKVVIGVGEEIVGSTPYTDHDKPTPTPTPTPEATPVPTVTDQPEITPHVTMPPSGDGVFTKDDIAVIVGEMRITPGMDYTGKENIPGKVVDKYEGVSCLQSGYDINYVYKDFQIDTIRQNERQYIYIADFKGGSAVTEAGIGIGSSEDDVLAAYGTPTEDTLTQRIYISGNLQMAFYITDEKVTEILLVDSSFR